MICGYVKIKLRDQLEKEKKHYMLMCTFGGTLNWKYMWYLSDSVTGCYQVYASRGM